MLLVALAIAGTAAAVFTPRAQVAQADESNAALKLGKQLFDTSCVSCHGANLQGVPERGPSLIGVGEAAVYFQVSTGRMPAMSLNSQAPSKAPAFTENQIDALGAYVQANGGGPERPINPDGSLKSNEQLRDGSIARGGDLFRLNCASCHNFTGKGGALSSGKYAPDLGEATPQQIYTAMLTVLFGVLQLFTDNSKSTSSGSGILTLIVMGLAMGWYFTKYNTWMQPDPKTGKPAWGKVIWGLLGSLLIIMLIVFVLSIPALSVINPVLPGWADILVAAAAYGIRWLVRRHYGIEGTSLSPDKLTMKKK